MITPEILSQARLFDGLTEEQLATIADLCEEVTCQEGEVLFWEGDQAEWLYILLEGEITIYVQLSSRPERVTVSVIKQPYQTFAWSGVVAPYRYTASALCETECRLIALDGQAFMKMLEQEPVTGFVVIRRIAEVIASRLRNTRVALLKTL
ncbi:MAG: cyclic nucleotide-binding domain-containing protein [Anaerolineales bacterium]|nr:MAG: cyclic nucleotide-binding domain-containing protein [Anaerolineales bacterium]